MAQNIVPNLKEADCTGMGQSSIRIRLQIPHFQQVLHTHMPNCRWGLQFSFIAAKLRWYPVCNSGSFCFLIFFVAHALQLIDIFVFVWRICKKHPLTASNFFRQVFIICTFIYGILIYLFSIAVIKNVGKSVYGVCIYFNMVSVVILIGVVVY